MIDVSLSKSFLNPKSVAIIGASANPKKTSSRAQRFLVSHGYKGKIFPVNPNREEIFGLKCYPNLKSINEHIDISLLLLIVIKLLKQLKMLYQKKLDAPQFYLEDSLSLDLKVMIQKNKFLKQQKKVI